MTLCTVLLQDRKGKAPPGGKFIYKFCGDLVDGDITSDNATLDAVFDDVKTNCPALLAYEDALPKVSNEDVQINDEEKTATYLLLSFCFTSAKAQSKRVCFNRFCIIFNKNKFRVKIHVLYC